MKTLKISADNEISIIDVNFDDFKSIQKALGGHFETVHTVKMKYISSRQNDILLIAKQEPHCTQSHLGLVFKVNFDSLSGVPKPIKPSILLPNAFLGNFSVSGFSQKNSLLPYIPDLLNLAFALVVILQKSHSLHFGIIYFTSQLLHSLQRILLLHKVPFIIDSLGQVGWTYTISSPTLPVLCLQVLYFSAIIVFSLSFLVDT